MIGHDAAELADPLAAGSGAAWRITAAGSRKRLVRRSESSSALTCQGEPGCRRELTCTVLPSMVSRVWGPETST